MATMAVEQVPSDSRAVSAWYPLAIAIAGAAVVARALSYSFTTTDYTGSLAHWFVTLQTQGFAAFSTPFADYAPLYLYMLRLLAYIPVSSLYSIKTLSIAFDVLLAALAYLFVREARPDRSRAYAWFAAASMFAIPTIVINSALWAQSDAIYAVGVLASLYFLIRRQPLIAVVMFALALSVKVQAIFFLPMLIGYLLRERWKLSYLLLIPLIFFVTLVPALANGGSFAYWGLIYLRQAGEYPWLSLSAPSIFAFLNQYSTGPYSTFLLYGGLGLAGIAALASLAYVAVRRFRLRTEQLVLASLWCVLAIPYFLPRMHERYFYLADVTSVIYALLVPRRWYVAALVVLSSFLSYMPFLSGQVSIFAGLRVDVRISAAILSLVLIFLTWRLLATNDRRSPYTPVRSPA